MTSILPSSRHRYPQSLLLNDYLKTILGLIGIVVLLVTVPVLPWITWGMVGIGGLFIGFLWVTVLRHLTEISVNSSRITRHKPWPKEIEWNSLSLLQLRYFSTRRDKTNGWMQLILKDSKVCLRIDSHIENFQQVVEYALDAAYKNQLSLSSITLDNVRALGINVPVPQVYEER